MGIDDFTSGVRQFRDNRCGDVSIESLAGVNRGNQPGILLRGGVTGSQAATRQGRENESYPINN
jgi:hypothetical protein